MTRTVDFFIVGEPKSGTTALAAFLGEHPGVFMATPKEPDYFATDLREESDAFHGRPVYFRIRTERAYHDLFRPAEADQLLGEASTCYLYSKVAAQRIRAYNPDAKIIVMLRNPVEFLPSLHMQFVNETTETEPDFAAALGKEPDRRAGRDIPRHVRTPSYLHYSERIRYADHLRRFCDAFGPEQILVLVTEDFQRDNAATYRRVLAFLGVPGDHAPDFRAVHGSRSPRFPQLNMMLNEPVLKAGVQRALGPRTYTRLQMQVSKVLFRDEPRAPVPVEVAGELLRMGRAEAERVGQLLDRDLVQRWGLARTPEPVAAAPRASPVGAPRRWTPARVIPPVFYTALVVFMALYLRGIDYDRLRALSLSPGHLLLATGLALGFRYWGAMIWLVILRGLGVNELGDVRHLLYIYAKTWLGRYIPGKVTWILGRVYFASRQRIPRPTLAVAAVLESALQIVALLGFSLLLLLVDDRLTRVLSGGQTVLLYLVTGGLLLVMWPPLFRRLLQLGSRLLRRGDLEAAEHAGGRTIATGFLLYGVGSLISGASNFFLLQAMYPELGFDLFWYVVGALNLAGALGILAVFAPSGLGVKDGIQFLFLRLVLPLEVALVSVVLVRLWSIVVDLLFFGLARAMTSRHSRERAPEPVAPTS